VSPKIVVIAGPTASGKTALALELARRFDGEIIGADSVQIYRGFDIGSAKPTPAELSGVPHALIDAIDPREPIDAMIFARMADEAIASALSREKLPIVTGGTGLWLRALLRGLVDLPEPDPEIRARLMSEVESRGAPSLHALLSRIDPLAAEDIHENDAFRIVRALEVFEQTGRRVGELRRAHALGAPRYDAFFFVLDPSLEELTPRIEARLEAMFAAGWVEEVKGLRETYGQDVRPFGSVGYKELLAHVCGEISLDEARRLVRKSTRIYARRQKTWFRNEPGVTMRGTPTDLLATEALADFVSRR
jgi:tRNA dimethylallyltransferase